MDSQLNAKQLELVERAESLAMERFAPRAAELDRRAAFPFEDFADLAESGLLGLCVPESCGGLGADFETYCLVAERLAKGNASTALTYNMHCLTMMMMGEMADRFPMSEEMRRRHAELRDRKFREVVTEGVYYGQPHSEPVELGETDTAFKVGGRRFGTTARKVDGGYIVNGRKFFVSLSDSAPYFATPALLLGDAPWMERTLYLQVPRGAEGVTFTGDWDPTGMRATVSREMHLKDAFIPDEGEVLPPGVFGGLYLAAAHLPLSFAATFLGLMGQAYEYAVDYLTGKVDGAPGREAISPATGLAVGEMLIKLEAARALFYRSISEAKLPSTRAIRQRARAAHITIQRTVIEITQEAMRVCGGRGTLKQFPLERYARDARAGAVMRPWTQDIALENLWERALDMTPPKQAEGE